MNNLTTQPQVGLESLARRQALTGILEHAVASLELTEKQRTSVETTYREVGAHLSSALKCELPSIDIFPQGSYRLGTVIRPWRDITEVFDLDVVFRLVRPSAGQNPRLFREAVGSHLRAKYNGTVQPLAKGWRLDFSKERDYYLDVIPAMDSPTAGIIDITSEASWRPTNPRGYASWFENIAKVMPRFGRLLLANEARMNNRQAKIESLPEHTDFKFPLQRITQLSKRHRDYHFNKKLKTPNDAPASIVLTTLLAKSYERCVASQAFESGYDLLLACVRAMPDFIHTKIDPAGKTTYTLSNPSLISENLISKWNDEPGLAKAFFNWNHEYTQFVTLLAQDRAPQRALLEQTIGKGPIDAAFKQQMDTLSGAREAKMLSVAPTIGLTVGAGIAVPGLKIHGLR